MDTYDEVYSQDEFYWEQDPNNLCKHAVGLFAPSNKGKVIDLGCREGKDIIYFVRNGFVAVGVDLSKPGLQKTKQWALKEGIYTSAVPFVHY